MNTKQQLINLFKNISSPILYKNTPISRDVLLAFIQNYIVYDEFGCLPITVFLNYLQEFIYHSVDNKQNYNIKNYIEDIIGDLECYFNFPPPQKINKLSLSRGWEGLRICINKSNRIHDNHIQKFIDLFLIKTKKSNKCEIEEIYKTYIKLYKQITGNLINRYRIKIIIRKIEGNYRLNTKKINKLLHTTIHPNLKNIMETINQFEHNIIINYRSTFSPHIIKNNLNCKIKKKLLEDLGLNINIKKTNIIASVGRKNGNIIEDIYYNCIIRKNNQMNNCISRFTDIISEKGISDICYSILTLNKEELKQYYYNIKLLCKYIIYRPDYDFSKYFWMLLIKNLSYEKYIKLDRTYPNYLLQIYYNINIPVLHDMAIIHPKYTYDYICIIPDIIIDTCLYEIKEHSQPYAPDIIFQLLIYTCVLRLCHVSITKIGIIIPSLNWSNSIDIEYVFSIISEKKILSLLKHTIFHISARTKKIRLLTPIKPHIFSPDEQINNYNKIINTLQLKLSIID